MRYQIGTGGWPIGSWLIPVDTILDISKPNDWTRLAAGRVPPLNARPMDDEAYQLMLKSYPVHRHLIVPAQGFEPPKNK